MWWYLVLCAGSSATDCPPVPATAMAGQRATANATALAAREVAATLRRDAPAPGAVHAEAHTPFNGTTSGGARARQGRRTSSARIGADQRRAGCGRTT